MCAFSLSLHQLLNAMLSNCRARRGNPPFLPFFDDCNVINSDNRNELLSHLGTIHLRYGTGFQRSTLSSNAGLGRSSRSRDGLPIRSEEHTSELQSPMHISYAVFC